MPKNTEKQIKQMEEELQKLKKIEALEKEIKETKEKKSKPEPSSNRTKLKGIGGWLILVVIGLVVSIIQYLNYFLEGAVGPTGIEYLDNIITFESIGMVVFLGFTVYVLILMSKKSREFPKIFTYLILALLGFAFLDFALMSDYSGPGASEAMETGLVAVVQAAIYAAIWIPYMRKSVRVKNTFVE
jgi:magnesium-transporting ATPase (P-type)